MKRNLFKVLTGLFFVTLRYGNVTDKISNPLWFQRQVLSLSADTFASK